MMIRITRTTPYASLTVDFDPHGDVHLPQVLREMDKVAAAIERRDAETERVRAMKSEMNNLRLYLAQEGADGMYSQRIASARERISVLESALAEAEARLAEVEG